MKNKYRILAALLCLVLTGGMLRAQTGDLPRAVPEAEGVPSEAVHTMFDSLMALPRTEIHSVVVVRHGKVIGELHPAPFAPEYRHTMYSCSKTFVAAGVGLAIADNRLRLDDRVVDFFPEQLPDTMDIRVDDITVRDLLTMTAGITPDWQMRSLTPHWIRTYLSKPIAAEPGTKFQYDSLCSYLLAAMVQRATGKTLLDYLQERIFTPMHITEVGWELSPEGYNTGGWGLHIQSESLAKFGLMLLDGGRWQGKQLLPEWWVREMMTEQKPGTNYGYQMWKCEYPGAWRADGALGQFVIVVPDKDMVVVITQCSLLNGVAARRAVWEQLLPKATDTPLPEDKKAYRQLQKMQTRATLPFVQGKAKAKADKLYDGATIALPDNKYGFAKLSFNFDRKARQVVMGVTDRDGNAYKLLFGHKRWDTVSTSATPPYSISPIGKFTGIEGPFRVAGSYAWKDKHTLRLKAHYVNWISALDITVRFDGDKAHVRIGENYSNQVTELECPLTKRP